MSTKQTILGMTALFVLCMGYYFFLVYYVYPKHPQWMVAQTQPDQTESAPLSPQQSGNSISSSTFPSSQSSISPATMPAGLQAIVTGPSVASARIGSTQPSDPTYALGMDVSPLAASLDSVTINSFKNIDADGLYVFQQPIDPSSAGPLATGSLSVDGQTIDLSHYVWGLESSSRDATTFGLQIVGADHKTLLHLTKTFQVKARGPSSNRDQTAAGYFTEITYHIQNLSSKTLGNVQIDTAGPTMPSREMERFDDRTVVSGYDRGDQTVEFSRDMLAEFKPENADKDITVYKGYKFLWAGTSSNYFAAIVLPDNEGAMSQVQIHCLNPQAPSDERIVETDFNSAAVSIAPGATADLPLSVFFGPKDRSLLEGDFYSSFPRFFNQLLGTSSSMCAFCAFPWLVDGLVDLLRAFHFVFRDWGLAIIALVVLVRVILHPISKHSQVSMMRLQKMGPEMERLKKKYGSDKEGLSKAQMEMHKEMGIAPFLGCLPMFLQMPIWIALYSALQNDIALRQSPFLWGLTWIHDLARPDRLIHWDSHPFIVPFLGLKIVSLNILPLAVAVVMFLQQKLNPQAPAITEEQQQQQKMMRYMSLLFSLFFYWMPSGLNLYILTSSTIAIVESKIIRKHVKEKEEEEKKNRVIIDAKPTRQGKQSKSDRENLSKQTKQGWLAGMWSRLQEKAEEVRRDAEKRGKR
jgi:YidC/Oxa1 family membrane protein insertase